MENKYLNNLYVSCENLATIDEFKNNKNNVFSLVTPIISSFNQIRINTNDDQILNSAISLIADIKEKKPQLKGVVDAILEIINEPIINNKNQIRR